MDTTELYIQMCREAREIQEKWNRRTGDFIYDYRLTSPGVTVYCSEIDEYIPEFGQRYDSEFIIFLPRQDQLQEMLFQKIKGYIPAEIIEHLRRFMLCRIDFHWKTLEQLWLAFVMDRLYNKRWTGQTWEEIR